ncbi:MAG TPA: hypothetical protein VFT41_08100 [Gemmatimonadaceae bacterium]|nr:hypothetical protein [Gemmatimonadaceae bacterium]
MRISRFLPLAALALGTACDSNRSVAPVATTERPAQFAKGPATDPACRAGTLKDDQKGKLKENSCEFTLVPGGRREDLYALSGAGSSQMMTFTASAEFSGIFGITEADSALFKGTVWGYEQFVAGTPISFSIVGSSADFGFFLGGTDSTQLGKYRLTTTVGAVSHSCDRATFLQGTVAFHTSLDGSNSCTEYVQYSPYPEAIGKPLWTHNYYAKVLAGHAYTVRVDGLDASFGPGLTIFGGGVLAQSVGPIAPDGARELTFTAPATRWVLVEISSGRFVNGTWTQQTGSYGLTFTSN